MIRIVRGDVESVTDLIKELTGKDHFLQSCNPAILQFCNAK
jgi:hypothetical protein